MSQPSALSRTPLFDWHSAQGGRLVDFADWSMPVQYTSIVEEHVATRTSVGLFDISHMGRFELTGPQVAAAIDRLVTRRVTDMRTGQIRYSLVCNESGGILDDILVYAIAPTAEVPRFQLVVNASNRPKLWDWFQKHLAGSDVTLRDDTTGTAMIAVQGPRAMELLGPLVDAPITTMRYYTGRDAKFEGQLPVYLTRTGYTGEDGCEIVCAGEHAMTVWRTLIARGVPVGGRACGLGARDTLRLEAGMPLYGHELSESHNPIEAGLAFAVTFEGREFIGRDALRRAQADSQHRVRIGLQLDGRRVPREGSTVLDSGEVGVVTSGTFSPTFDRPLAMAYVEPTSAAVGQTLAVDIRGTQYPAVVVPIPFYQRGTG